MNGGEASHACVPSLAILMAQTVDVKAGRYHLWVVPPLPNPCVPNLVLGDIGLICVLQRRTWVHVEGSARCAPFRSDLVLFYFRA